MAVTAAGLVGGWRLFWFLTDDAYISFRYISNSLAGHGYVWNPPPFRPVEGYTNFLWIVLLDGVWRLTGVAPPDSANWLSLLFAYGTLFLAALMMWRLAWPARLLRWRGLFVALAPVGVLTNRTFLAWTSSGLETAMFNFFIMAWVFVASRGARSAVPSPEIHTQCCLWSLSAAATGIALTRPDGLLFVAATATLIAIRCVERRRARWLIALAPLALVQRVVSLKVPVAPAWPAWARPYATTFDRMQAWLIDHYVCIRHQEHKVALAWWMSSQLPTREEGERIESEHYPVLVASGGIGGLGWVLPHVNIIDLYGLNDCVVARTPPPPGKFRRMAHDRDAPNGYVDAFRPNVVHHARSIRVLQRAAALTDGEIRAAETAWARRVGGTPPGNRPESAGSRKPS